MDLEKKLSQIVKIENENNFCNLGAGCPKLSIWEKQKIIYTFYK